ncbi:MAG: ATP-dependent DNA helicase RecG [Pyrinomonadaceae bacterium]
MSLGLQTPVAELYRHGIAKLTAATSRKLAVAVAEVTPGARDAAAVTVEDLLNYFPMRYEDRSNLITVDRLYDGIEASVEINVRNAVGYQVGKNRHPRQPPLYIFEITGGDAGRLSKPVLVKWFVSGRQAPHVVRYYEERFKRGTRFVAYGKWEFDERRETFQLKPQKPEELEILPPLEVKDLFAADGDLSGENDGKEDQALSEDVGDPEFATVHTGRRVPVYRKLGPFQTKRLREIMHSVTGSLDESTVPDNLPAEMLQKHDLIPRADALKRIHFPLEGESLFEYEAFRSPAQRRLIFEEFFWLSFALAVQRGERKKEPKGTVIEISLATKRRLLELVPFTLTAAQARVLKTIFEDMRSDAPMHRLVQGDVGSGKTIVALSAMFAAMENGYQTALMAPTEILAEQHGRNAKRFFDGSGYRVEVLTGSTRAADKREIVRALAAGEVHAVIGTHALIQEGVEFDRLGLAVIDEQHRFGVMQRAELQSRGYNPDILVMTATPIPRSLAMTVYGELDVSVIDELPPGRTPVKTVVVGEDKRHGVYKGIEREIRLGRQAYVVYPLIEESAKLDLKAAKDMYEELRDRVFPEFSVGLLHGRMKAAEKDAVMSDFVAGRLQILVSTTVIEVGVDVPNASLMVIEHAERFGLSQLHQLRGRVGRGSEQSFCVLLTGDKRTATARERLGIMEETNDGFRIAEKDLEIRGQGDILGTKQSGLPTFKIGNIIRDYELLVDARQEAERYLTERRDSPETKRLVETVLASPRFRLARVG